MMLRLAARCKLPQDTVRKTNGCLECPEQVSLELRGCLQSSVLVETLMKQRPARVEERSYPV